MSSLGHRHLKRKFSSPLKTAGAEAVYDEGNDLCGCTACLEEDALNSDYPDDCECVLPCGLDEIGEHDYGCRCTGCLAELEQELKLLDRQQLLADGEDLDDYITVAEERKENAKDRAQYFRTIPHRCGCPDLKCISARNLAGKPNAGRPKTQRST